MKKVSFARKRDFFQRNPSLRTGEIRLAAGEIAFGGEIPLRGVKDGFHFTECASIRFHQRRKPLISPRRSRDFTKPQPRFH